MFRPQPTEPEHWGSSFRPYLSAESLATAKSMEISLANSLEVVVLGEHTRRYSEGEGNSSLALKRGKWYQGYFKGLERERI